MTRLCFTIIFVALCFSSCKDASEEAIFSLADTLFKSGEYQRAIEQYSTIIEEGSSKKYYYALYQRAYSYFHLHDFKNALRDLESARTIRKEAIDFKWIMGNSYWIEARIYHIQNDIVKSSELLEKATEFKQDSLLFSTLGYCQILLQKYPEALQNLNKAISLDDKNAYAYSNRALLFLKLENLENAQLDIEQSIKIDNTNPYAYKHKGMIYLELKDSEKACEALNYAKELGYEEFRKGEPDSQEVEELIKVNCG